MRESLPIKLHQKLINKSFMILFFGMDKFASDTSKEVKILHKYNDRSLRMKNVIKQDKNKMLIVHSLV